jgi:hypothetical protein
MLQLMRENPRRALEESLKWHEWAALPPWSRGRLSPGEPLDPQREVNLVNVPEMLC